MSKIDAAGGFAYPSGENDNVGGITVRDLFAAHALTGVLAFSTGEPDGCQQMEPKTAAREAYAIADAMLAERAKPQSAG